VLNHVGDVIEFVDFSQNLLFKLCVHVDYTNTRLSLSNKTLTAYIGIICSTRAHQFALHKLLFALASQRTRQHTRWLCNLYDICPCRGRCVCLSHTRALHTHTWRPAGIV
jgi:hypothetical protein